MASRGRRGGIRPRAGFQTTEEPKEGIHSSILKQARKTGQLNASGRNLSKVPDEVWRINTDVPEEAKSVSLDNTDERWWDQADLTKLILASNCLTSISEDIALLTALTVLDLHDNKLESLPESLGKCEYLQKLDISRNNLKELPACIGKLDRLKSLHVEHNQLTQLPEEIGKIIYLEELDISHNQLTSLPVGIGYMCKIIKLNVSNNKLVSLPPEIGTMNALRQFEATHNELKELPSQFGSLRNLEQLYLRHNKLTNLPILEQCVSLKELHLGNNQIREITASHLEHLTAISVLDLRDNKIASLPEEIAQLEHLERLDVTNNDLSSLPNVLGTVTSLKSIVVDGNPMRSIRRDIIMRGTQEMKKYLRSRITEPTDQSAPKEAVQKGTGQSGVIGGAGEGINPHDVCQTKTLDYSNKKCPSIPDEIWQVAAKGEVTSVNLSKNCLTEVPLGIMLVSDHIKELYLGFNKISSLHPDTGLYFKLTTLDLRNNLLTDLPQDMSSLKELREIVLSCNRLTKLPSVIYDLPKLEILFANDNKIDCIDASGFQRLTCLATVDLQNNSLAQIPAELGLCTQIKSLQLGGNLFRNPRPAVLAKGTNALLEHLRNRIVSL